MEYSDCEQLLSEALAISKLTFGEEDSITLTIMDYLASAYQNLTKFDMAESMLIDILRSKRANLAYNDEDVLVSINNLADYYSNEVRAEISLS